MYILLYALMCRSIWVKSGEEWVKSCCELFTPAIALFIGIPEGLVKSEEYFRVCFCSFTYYLSKYVSMAMRGMFSIQS